MRRRKVPVRVDESRRSSSWTSAGIAPTALYVRNHRTGGIEEKQPQEREEKVAKDLQ